jgi:micrococcal nuclease
MKRNFRITLIIAFLWAIQAPAFAEKYKVVRVVDGDTIAINYNGKTEKVRLLRNNTPESVHPDR